MPVNHFGVNQGTTKFVNECSSVNQFMTNCRIYCSDLSNAEGHKQETEVVSANLTVVNIIQNPIEKSEIYNPQSVKRDQETLIFLINSDSVLRQITVINRSKVIYPGYKRIYYPNEEENVLVVIIVVETCKAN